MNPPLTEAEVIEVCARRLQGQSWKKISDWFACKPRVLRRHIHQQIFERAKLPK